MVRKGVGYFLAFYLPFLWKGKSWGSMPFVQESCGIIRDS